MSDFPNFDQLLKLANEDPDKLESFRQEQVELLINRAQPENRRRLRGLQFQIDAQKKLHDHSPTGACIKISRMMHESFAELRVWLNDITGLDDAFDHSTKEFSRTKPETAIGKVLPFSAG